MRIAFEALPFAQAVEFFRQKGLALSPESWRDIWGAANARAFTVARVTALDVLEDIRRAVDEALDQGIPFGEFQRDLADTLTRKGWFSPTGEGAQVQLPDGAVRKRLTPWRLETVYRTNLQSSYAAGRYRQMLEIADSRPYWFYDAVGDARTRPSHMAMDGKVYRSDHPIWNIWYPPNGFNCRCRVRALSQRDMARSNLQESISGPATWPDDGFRYNPGVEAWRPDPGRYGPEARGILENLGNESPV